MRALNRNPVSRNYTWSYPPKNRSLSNEEVHVWVADLDDGSRSQEFEMILSPDEKERSARFHFSRDRDHFISGRGLLRTILSNYTNTPAASLQFGYEKNGKPCLINAAKFGDLNFNLSHSGGMALFAVARDRTLGVDLENVRFLLDLDEIAARCFSPEEQLVLSSLEPPQKEESFFRYWTRKEAALKCDGTGFSESDDEIQAGQFDGFFHELTPAKGYLATLAVRGKPFVLKTWQWQRASCASIPVFA
jgi:4'-phosphopantetheinyl transferase